MLVVVESEATTAKYKGKMLGRVRCVYKTEPREKSSTCEESERERKEIKGERERERDI